MPMRVNLTMVAVVLTATVAPAARGDTVLKGAPGVNPIPETGVRVTGIHGIDLTYTTAGGDTRTVPLGDVQQVTADGQPAFDAAEAAYAARNYSGALDGYQSALAGGVAPDWVMVRSAQRLAAVARVQHRYDAQVTAYVALLAVSPEGAAAARPAAPQPNNPTLDVAQTTVGHALDSASGSTQKSALLSVQLDIDRAKGDKAGLTQTLQQLAALGSASPADQAMLKLATADAALDAKDYAQAEADVQQNRQLFADPAQQVDALYVLARARDGQAGTGAEAKLLKDVALAYMRVVTFGATLPDRPHVAESLLRTAQIEEKLQDLPAALTVYQQLAADRAYAGSPAAAEAATALARLKK